jgi:D-inositol-3-phosphate glycosyltransferase
VPEPASQSRVASTDVAPSGRRDLGGAGGNGAPARLCSLVRAVDQSRGRHVYAVGGVPPGMAASELGSLHTAAAPGAQPVWLTADGRVVTPEHRPDGKRPRPWTLARWCLAPAAWRGSLAPSRRAREMLRRIGQAPGHAARRPVPAEPAGDPVGWVDRERTERSVALWGAVHPVTGDQLLTIDRWEAVDLGYAKPVLLGHLDWEAPLTGRLVAKRPELPWASRLGRGVRSDAAHAVPDPPGRVEAPAERVTAPFRVRGFVLTPDAPVARVEMFVDGRPVGRARTGLECPDVAGKSAHPDAPACGWEHLVLPAHLPDGARTVTVSAVASDLRGRELPVGEARVELAAPADDDDPTRLAQLRERARRTARAGRVAAGAGTNVLVFTHDLGVGGAQLYLAEVLMRLSFFPATAITVVAPSDGPLRGQLEDHGIQVHVTAGYAGDDSERYESRLAELAAWAAPQGFDVVFVNTMMAFPGVEVAELLGLPSVWSIHESFDLDAFWVEAYPDPVPAHIRARGAAALRSVSAALFVAGATRDQYAVHGDPGRFLTLPYGIEFDFIDRFRAGFDRAATRRELGLPADATVVLCLGMIEARKAQAPLAMAFGEVADQHPDAVLALVGALDESWRGPYAAGLRERVARSGLSSRVSVRPLDADPFRWHGAADVLVCPSDVESLPRVVVEAMAFETPVVASNVFGHPDVIEDGRTGWLFEPRDVASLAAGLDRVLGTPAAERVEVGRAASRFVRGRHDPAAYVERLVALLDGLAADPGADPAALIAS